jgi:hypothetical protein
MDYGGFYLALLLWPVAGGLIMKFMISLFPPFFFLERNALQIVTRASGFHAGEQLGAGACIL